MKRRFSPATVLASLTFFAVSSATKAGVREHAASSTSANPVERALDLIKDLQQKVYRAAQEEEQTYFQYSLWCQKESKGSQDEVENNKARIEELTAKQDKALVSISSDSMHLADLAGLESMDKNDLKALTEVRKKEHADFLATESELVASLDYSDKAMAKLQGDIVSLGGTMPATASSAFLQRKESQGPQLSAKAMKAFGDVMMELAKAASLTTMENVKQNLPALLQQSEEAEDERAMARIESQLDREESEVNGKGKRQRQAGQGKERSGGEIRRSVPVETLQEGYEGLQQVSAESKKSLQNARDLEVRYASNYEQIKKAVEGKVEAEAKDVANTKLALAKAQAEKAEADGGIAAAQAGIKTTQEYLVTLERDCMAQAKDFEAQKKARTDELNALKAAAKELQGIVSTKAAQSAFVAVPAAGGVYSFVQLSSERDKGPVMMQVLESVKELADTVESSKLTQLASRISAVSRFSAPEPDKLGKVKTLVKDMIATLNAEQHDDVTKKKFCEEETKRTKDTQARRTQDYKKKQSDLDVTRSEIATLREELTAHSEQLANISKRKLQMTEMREKEHAEHVKAYKDMEEGLTGVRAAIKALRDYYSYDKDSQEKEDFDVNMARAAQGKAAKLSAAPVASGGGAGAIALLETIESDFSENMGTMSSQEQEALNLYNDLMSKSEVQKAQIDTNVKLNSGLVSKLEREESEHKIDTASAKQEMEAIIEYLENLKEECTIKVDREQRIARRAKEIEGLQNILKILERVGE
eukprot:TRINITY_DN41048_c0_g1_i1.p1 TRINITY_DN41048_c0_g1~~TRINITY_DN41048_c0_g1_i1.p1  ORF type:complete len:761 (-),score=246.60 TRINITY_DN41048_c0_g1_i1:76-2358(-)